MILGAGNTGHELIVYRLTERRRIDITASKTLSFHLVLSRGFKTKNRTLMDTKKKNSCIEKCTTRSTKLQFYYGKGVVKTKQPAMTISLSVVLSSSRMIFV